MTICVTRNASAYLLHNGQRLGVIARKLQINGIVIKNLTLKPDGKGAADVDKIAYHREAQIGEICLYRSLLVLKE